MRVWLLIPLLSACQLLGPAQGQDPEGFAQLLAADSARLILRLPDLNREATLLHVQDREGISLWRSMDNVQVLTKGGQLYATAGLGDDLLSVKAVLPAQGQGLRVQRRLSSGAAVVLQTYHCQFTPQGATDLQVGPQSWRKALLWHEDCEGPKDRHQNRYWLVKDEILQSETDLGPRVGRVQLTRLEAQKGMKR